MIIAVAARKASPGVTSLTAQLALLWNEPGVVRLVVEADPSGGTLAARWSAAHGLTWEPGLLSLSTSRAPLTAESLPLVTQPLADGLFMAAAPPVPDQVSAALNRWGDQGAAELAGATWLRAFVDCGRLGPASPAMALARRAAVTILVCRPRLDEVSALVPSVPELTTAGVTLGLVCIGDGPYRPVEVAATAGIPLLGVIPIDPGAAAAFERDGFGAGRSYWRSSLVRTASELTEVILGHSASLLGPPLPGPAPTASLTQPRAPFQARAPHPVASPAPVSPAILAARARRAVDPETRGWRSPASPRAEDPEEGA